MYKYNEEFGNWELGFQKKAVSQKRKAIVVDLEEEDLGEGSNMQERQAVPSIQYEEMNSYDMIKFKKNEDFDFMID